MSEAILSIDVFKKELSIALLVKGSFKRRKISNHPVGFTELTAWLKRQNVTYVKARLEATGRYGDQITNYLRTSNL